ncbi:MAG TPA: CheR family methyltransferase [Fibrobacteria bacterium]|nr:CheR family methyltransferase [Fibrobacteria bacterium]
MTLLDSRSVEEFRTLAAGRFGLHFDESKRDFLESILRLRMEAGGHPDAETYLRALQAKGGPPEFDRIAEALTVNETFFHRNIDHFRAMTESLIPERMEARAGERKLRMLSAGCSSGEEAYTLAMSVRDHFPELSSWDVGIRAVDVNPAVLAAAAEGLFSPWSLRGTDDGIRDRHFSPEGGRFRIAGSLRSMVTFEKRNLAEANPDLWGTDPGFDFVFCRNVIMYFLPETAARLVARIHAALLPGGYLFLGHAETLRGLSQEFELCHTHGTFYYRRPANAGSAPAARGTAAWSGAAPSGAPDPAWDAAGAWVDVIRRASEKIAGLADRSGSASPGLAAETERLLPGSGSAGPRILRTAAPPSWNRAQALDLLQGERFAEAMEVLQRLPPESASDPDALLLRAVLATNMGDREEGEAVCRRLLAADALNAGAHYLVALCREHAGDAAAAEDHDRTAIYLDAGFAMPWLHLGLLATRDGRNAEARRNLEQALALLAREDSARILLFGGGFGREALAQMCRSGIRTLEGR